MALGLLELYARGGEQVTRASYVHALGAIGDRSTAPFLLSVTQNASETDLVRAMAASSLGLLCDEDRVPRPAQFSRDHNYTLNLTFLPELYYLY